MKKSARGSILIETVAGLFILTVIGWIMFTLIVSMSKSVKFKSESRELYESLHAVVNEVRYNLNEEDLRVKLVDNKIIIPYNRGFLDELREKSLLQISNGDKVGIITIEFLEDTKDYKIRMESKGEVLEQIVNKAL